MKPAVLLIFLLIAVGSQAQQSSDFGKQGFTVGPGT